MHTRLVEAMARKGVDLVVADRFTAEALGEMLYPLARAQAFAEEARRLLDGEDGPAPLGAFEALLVDYAALCDLVDRQRREGAGVRAAAVLRPALERVERSAGVVRDALAAGEG
jgi:hypothetical protein